MLVAELELLEEPLEELDELDGLELLEELEAATVSFLSFLPSLAAESELVAEADVASEVALERESFR